MQRQDRLASDVDRGFTALENGDIEEAEACLERCSRIDRKHPDVVALAAAVADARGDGEAALAKYSELSELRPDDPMPRICMARLQLHDLGDPDAALDTLDAAFDLAELSLAAEDPRAALRWVEIARKDEALAIDALHLLGRIHEARGDRAAMIEAWQ